jgi:hypothetical protein
MRHVARVVDGEKIDLFKSIHKSQESSSLLWLRIKLRPFPGGFDSFRLIFLTKRISSPECSVTVLSGQ